VLTIWIGVGATALVSFAIKAVGPAVPGDRPIPVPRPVSLPSSSSPCSPGLVLSDIPGPSWSTADGALVLGVATAGGVRITGAPTPSCVIAAIAIAVALRVTTWRSTPADRRAQRTAPHCPGRI